MVEKNVEDTRIKYPNEKMMASHKAVCEFMGIADPAFCVLMIFDPETGGYRAYAGLTEDVKVIEAVHFAANSMLQRYQQDVLYNPQNHNPGAA